MCVSEKNGKSASAAFEDIRLAIIDHNVSKIISELIDVLDEELSIELDHIQGSSPEKINVSNDFDYDKARIKKSVPNGEEECDFTITEDVSEPQLGEAISVYWPDDYTFYPVTVRAIKDGLFIINYNYGDVETLNMSSETWNYHGSATSGNSSKV